MLRRSSIPVALVIAALAMATAPSRADDAATSFSATNNPTGAFRYGWTPTRGGAFTLYNLHAPDASGIDTWKFGTNQAYVAHNGTTTGKLVGGNTYTPPNGLNLLPGVNGEFSVVRWTAPSAGTYTINAHFQPRVFTNNTVSSEVAMLQGASVVFDRWISFGLGVNTASVSTSLGLAAGATVDFVVGNADENNALDVVGLDATITLQKGAPSVAGPVFTLGGQRFAGARWGNAFESIAFDPVSRRLASNDKIRDLCGNEISAGPDQNPGLCWDSRTGTYWQITVNRNVRRWSAAGVLLDTVFTIPPTFTVPGVGLDTLQAVSGIATDSNFVYVVDKGPDPTIVPSGEWLKFTRTGTPVKSSKTTNFDANLDMDPDAVVDDVCYVPYSSPIYPGKLLIALEHSGIQVIDTDGNFVDKFRWSTQGFATRPLSAFSGITVDPATGNLYLADNGFGAALVLTRIVPQGASYYAVGTVGNSGTAVSGVLQAPVPGCNLPLLMGYGLPPGSSGNYFGAAYRPANNSVYTMNYGDGELWRFDPRIGAGVRVGSTGVTGSAWGMAYDGERDVLYVASGYMPCHVVAIDPLSGAASSLPAAVGYPIGSDSDLAWNATDKKIYAVDGSVAPARLIRIDRDTGAGTVVGNTTFVRSLDFDAVSGALIAADVWNKKLLRIQPATGVADSIGPLPAFTGFEGLAVVPVPPNPLFVAAPIPSASESMGASISVGPNPTRGPVTISFASSPGRPTEVSVFDVAGRRVRRVADGLFAAGPHRLRWDGTDHDGHLLANGVYFVRVESGGETRVARIVLAR